jgi:hypothetical protein
MLLHLQILIAHWNRSNLHKYPSFSFFSQLDINWETDLVIPFNVKKEVCTDLFYSWVKELWFAPSDLTKTAILQDFKMVYVPFWLFEVDTSSRYVIGYTDKLLGESSELGVYKQR